VIARQAITVFLTYRLENKGKNKRGEERLCSGAFICSDPVALPFTSKINHDSLYSIVGVPSFLEL